MVSDKEILIQVVEKYIKGLASNFFGLSSLPVQSVITYIVRNWVDKHNMLIDLFVDKDGNINVPLIAEALETELKERKGFTIGSIKFTEADIEELVKAYNQIKDKNK